MQLIDVPWIAALALAVVCLLRDRYLCHREREEDDWLRWKFGFINRECAREIARLYGPDEAAVYLRAVGRW